MHRVFAGRRRVGRPPQACKSRLGRALPRSYPVCGTPIPGATFSSLEGVSGSRRRRGDRVRPVGPPGGRAEQVADRLSSCARAQQVLGDLEPLVERDPDRVVRDQRRHQPVAARQVAAFGGKGAEQAVEHDQHAAVVLVDVVGVRGVMDAMVRGRVEDVFQPAQLRHPFGMQPEL